MKRRKLIVAILLILSVSIAALSLIQVPYCVFALETETISIVPLFTIGNLTLQLRNFILSYRLNNQTYTIQIESADIDILTQKQDGKILYTIDIQATNVNASLTGFSTMSFTHLELHIEAIQQDTNTEISIVAFSQKPLWTYLLTLF